MKRYKNRNMDVTEEKGGRNTGITIIIMKKKY
jgi:hypothetical protein